MTTSLLKYVTQQHSEYKDRHIDRQVDNEARSSSMDLTLEINFAFFTWENAAKIY